MTYGITPHDVILPGRRRLSRNAWPRTLAGPALLVFSIFTGAVALYARLGVPQSEGLTPSARLQAPLRPTKPSDSTNTYGVLIDPAPYGALLDPGFSLGTPAVSLAESLPLRSNFETVAPGLRTETSEPETVVSVAVPVPPSPQMLQDVPLPARRPAELIASESPPRRQTAQQTAAAAADVPGSPDNRSFFEKLFGASHSERQVLAYAAPEDGAVHQNLNFNASKPQTSPYDRYTAVYDISARVVYMPDGSKLEAHSGLGDRMDDPRYVNERMRGATPPHLYDLTLRETLFHGVQALRLTPVGEGEVYGRTGLLAHRYMLGPNGDSNGCVSFKNYDAFLHAYLNGEVKRIAVVSRLN